MGWVLADHLVKNLGHVNRFEYIDAHQHTATLRNGLCAPKPIHGTGSTVESTAAITTTITTITTTIEVATDLAHPSVGSKK